MKTIEEKMSEANPYKVTKTIECRLAFNEGFRAGYTEANKWISIEEELPDEGTSVLVKNNHCHCQEWYIMESFLDNGKWQDLFTMKEMIGCVTHWRPID